MAVSRTTEYKLAKKQHYKIEMREGMFVADFVKTKYREIYEEASLLYNRINQNHPNKPNLRKTLEYKMWKNEIAQATNQPIIPIPRQRDRVNNPIQYPNMPVGHITTGNSTLHSDETATSGSPDNPNETATSDETCHQPGNQTVLTIPLMSYPNTPKRIQNPTEILETAYNETVVEEGQQQEILDPSLTEVIPDDIFENIMPELRQDPCLNATATSGSPDNPNETATSDETATQNTRGPSSETETCHLPGKQMVLTIPLMSYPNTPKRIQNPTEILETAYNETVAEEGQQQETLDPSLTEVIPDDIFEKIMSELRQDPCLNAIIMDIENQSTPLEEEIVGLDVDVPDIQDPLEDEMENMYWY